MLISKENNTKSSERAIECEFSIASFDLEAYKSNLFSMSPPRVGVPSITRRRTWSSTRVPQTEKNEMPTMVDVEKIHTPEYKQTTLHVEEEKELAQDLEHPKEDVE